MKQHTKILAALVAGVAVGAIARVPAAESLQRVVLAVEPLGTVFIRLITMVVVPLVIASVFVGVASLGDIRRLGRVGGKTLAYFLTTTLVAACIGVAAAQLARVGRDAPASLREGLALDEDTAFGRSTGAEAGDSQKPTGTEAGASQKLTGTEAGARQKPTGAEAGASQGTTGTGAGARQKPTGTEAGATAPTLVQTLVAMVPQNPFAAAAQTDLLPLIIAVCIFGAAATVVSADRRRALVEFFAGVNDLAMVVIGWLMRLAPAAVFVLIAAVVARVGVGVLRVLLTYAVIVVAALLAHVVLLMIVVRLVARVPVTAFLRSVSDALLLAFSTASSNATLPVSMAAARNRLGISSEVVSFVLPAGSTLNKNGAAIYKAITAVFIAELCGLDLGAGQMVTIVLTATLAAFAGTGVPGSSLVTTLIVLNAIGLGSRASAAVALVASVDRPLDMCRTTVNTLGNLVGATVIARSEGETVLPRQRT